MDKVVEAEAITTTKTATTGKTNQRLEAFLYVPENGRRVTTLS